VSGSYPVIRDADRVRRLAALPNVRAAMLERLATATVAVVGVGGLGCASAPYLAAAGVGHILLIDPGNVAATDLGRQVLYGPADVGRRKVAVAAARLRAQNPAAEIEECAVALSADNAPTLLRDADLVVDGLDDGAARDVLNAWAVKSAKPVVFGGALGYEGQVMVVARGGRPCLACLFGSVADAPAECSVEGVLGPLVGVVGALQAAEALKVIMGTGRTPSGRLFVLDALTGQSRLVSVPPRPGCPVCAGAAAP
jgi:molybdopterin/thiamine biosynthesis adenylyltransferase